MKRLCCALLLGAGMLGSVPASAQNPEDRTGPAYRAVNITLTSSGAGLDRAALRAVRKLVGKAIAAGTVDTFAVYVPRAGGPIPIEGGLSACAEAGFSSSQKRFNGFVRQLRAIHPQADTSLNVEPIDQCKPIEVTGPSTCAGIAGTRCSDEKQYCDFGVGKCKMPDAQGTCKTKPTICRGEFRPVCGCDGKTYGNACEAAAAGVSIEHEGECKKPQVCGGVAGLPCPEGQTCVDDPTDTCDPKQGGADCSGICQPKPQACGGITGRLCPQGQTCVDDPTDTCDPKQGGADCSGICQPKPQLCGGISALPCPQGQTCVDDPTDTCDPKQGGADCSGICQSK